ncbi:oligosaccharide reducing-end xylanase [Pelagirhabdus alkalitolerans]|uniref:Oligosaccharide reducing-end xylanase n=1 Tax=Pelagirhabdus alkalitolerans TaxID=1612202 RepID=A0A1G6JUM8_9BACI|nr:glycosyl hydrolase family 8 [Pelagirhabdus alkalitolerans]SDC22105.1 oligosaccharide reducing-end xylanase [Pelagirhabdus alkalitolerans]
MKQGAYETGHYRNLFTEFDIDPKLVDEKVQKTWDQLFTNQYPDYQIYFETDDGMGYMVDTGNDDVRTEGQSYGMMMAVQMDQQEVFDRIWKWSKTYMYMDEGIHKGYFAWSCALDGTKNAHGPAPDGEEYFAMALFFASNRWGDKEAPFDYSKQAKALLHDCVHKGENNDGHPMWEPSNHLIKFVPEVDFSDPSYHIPHFYELFAEWANPEDHDFWKKAAEASRDYIRLAAHNETGLSPEYAFYNGEPNHIRGFGDFFSDSYRVVCNVGLDYEWFRRSNTPTEVNEKVQAFFKDIPVEDYRRYTVDGKPFEEKSLHPIGLLASLAMASLATTGELQKHYVEKFWNTPLRTGERRYYDNCLYFFSLLSLAGKFKIWK